MNAYIEKNILKIIIAFLFLQPFLDLATSLCLNVFHISLTIGIVVRVLFLLFLGYYFVFGHRSKEKKKTYLYFVLLAIYFILFLLTMVKGKGLVLGIYEIQGLIRTFYFPIVWLFLWNIGKEKDLFIDQKHYIRILLIYLIIIIVPTVLGLGFNGYTEGKVGNVGWFHSTNEISAVLSILFPFTIPYLFQNKKNIMFKFILILLILAGFFMLGTKMTIVTLMITAGVYILKGLIFLIKRKKYQLLSLFAVGLILVATVMVILIPKTTFYQNIKFHLDYLGVTSITEIITNPKVIDHFIFSSRLTFLANTNEEYQQSDMTTKLFGMGYIKTGSEQKESAKLIEMDPFDIYYRQGPLGFILFFLPFLFTIPIGLKNKRKETEEVLPFYLSIGLAIFISCFVGHVLTSPAVSIFFAIVLIHYMTTIKRRNV